jgi:hypothetical protein
MFILVGLGGGFLESGGALDSYRGAGCCRRECKQCQNSKSEGKRETDEDGHIGILGVQVAVYFLVMYRSHGTGSEQLIKLCVERDAKERCQATEGHMQWSVSQLISSLFACTDSQST